MTGRVEAVESPERYHLETMIDGLAQDLYSTAERRFVPFRPWVFVRVLPREQVLASGLVLPETHQNKPMHEGIVLATWKPYARYRRYEVPKSFVDKWRREWNKSTEGVNPLSPLEEAAAEDFRRFTGKCDTAEIQHSELYAGDHVLFPHWAGLPVPGFSDVRYRIIREDELEVALGAVVGRMESAEPEGVDLRGIIYSSVNLGEPDLDAFAETLAAEIEKDFILVKREAHSVTLSGK